MRRKWNRFVAGLLSIIMLVTMLPMEVLAAGNGGKAEQPSQTMPFQDVKSSDWCAKAVEYVYSHGIFNGTSTATFSPSGTMTRGMFVTVLGRMAGVNQMITVERRRFLMCRRRCTTPPMCSGRQSTASQ